LFRQQVNQVCQIYSQATTLAQQGTHVISCDEMTGIQAIERAYPTEAMKLGQVERQEARIHPTWHTQSHCQLGCGSGKSMSVT
jgi:hypothetical protein